MPRPPRNGRGAPMHKRMEIEMSESSPVHLIYADGRARPKWHVKLNPGWSFVYETHVSHKSFPTASAAKKASRPGMLYRCTCPICSAFVAAEIAELRRKHSRHSPLNLLGLQFIEELA